jgi:hypothetical protein
MSWRDGCGSALGPVRNMTDTFHGDGTVFAHLDGPVGFIDTFNGTGTLTTTLTVTHPTATGLPTVTSKLPPVPGVVSVQKTQTTTSSVPNPSTTSFQTVSGLQVVSVLG